MYQIVIWEVQLNYDHDGEGDGSDAGDGAGGSVTDCPAMPFVK